jgi:hypothetical protein
MFYNKPTRWIYNCQKAMKSSTYGLLLVESQVVTELILEVRFILRSLVVALDGPTGMVFDSLSVVLNTSAPLSVFKIKCNEIAYH